jgi:putative phosphoesterase
MHIALLSDVHGNLPGVESVLADLEDFCPYQLVVAGDLTGGPFTNECINLLREGSARMILGNSDINLIRYTQGLAPGDWRTARQFGLIRWNAAHITAENLALLESLPEQLSIDLPGAQPIRVVHGAPWDPFTSIFPEKHPVVLDRAWDAVCEPVLACGHTHQPWAIRKGGRMAVNPGSVAGPLNGAVGAQYARLEWGEGGWQVDLRLLPYDVPRFKQAFRDRGLLEAGGGLVRAWMASIDNGQNIPKNFLDFAYALASKAGYDQCTILPDIIWDQACESFNWEEH